jgi:hypothetical protein
MPWNIKIRHHSLLISADVGKCEGQTSGFTDQVMLNFLLLRAGDILSS